MSNFAHDLVPDAASSEASVAEAAAEPPPPSPRLRHYVLALVLALAGGALGVVGAAAQELQTVWGIFAAAPIEEALKPAGIYILLVKWPYVLRGRVFTGVLTAVSGLTFGLIEASMYVFVYYPDAGREFVQYRFTVPLILHTTASAIVGLGLDRTIVDWANGLAPFPRRARNYLALAITLHMTYNVVAVALTLLGVIDFEPDG